MSRPHARPPELPVLFATGHIPRYRVGALAALHAREGIEVALFGGRSLHGGPAGAGELPFPVARVRPRELFALAAGDGHRAVVCPTGGRLAPAALWAGARRARLPLILWASLWAHPRSAAHLFTYLPLRALYRSADAVVTYGEHVSRYVRARGARNVFLAPQAVDNDFWGAQGVSPARALSLWPAGARTRFLFAGRAGAPEKGVGTLLEAWRRAAGDLDGAGLLIVGDGFAQGARAGDLPPGASAAGALDPVGLRAAYEAADVLVVPSLRTRTFLEPWGLVVNEAMNRGVAVIASDAVGAVAGGLLRDRDSGIVVRAGDAGQLAGALAELARSPGLRRALGEAGRRAVAHHTFDSWAEGFSRALASVGAGRTSIAAASVRQGP